MAQYEKCFPFRYEKCNPPPELTECQMTLFSASMRKMQDLLANWYSWIVWVPDLVKCLFSKNLVMSPQNNRRITLHLLFKFIQVNMYTHKHIYTHTNTHKQAYKNTHMHGHRHINTYTQENKHMYTHKQSKNFKVSIFWYGIWKSCEK